AAKFTTAELSRILSLLLAAQTDLRWTTSPRLTLELALVRATIPEADPSPAGLSARIERLERLAGVSVGAPEGVSVGAPEVGRAVRRDDARARVSPRQEVRRPEGPVEGARTAGDLRRGLRGVAPDPVPGARCRGGCIRSPRCRRWAATLA